jgi:hypothetical protein
VLEMSIVTADGEHLTVNDNSYQDLFWALRGGGGGTYGVITSVTYRTHPSTPFSLSFFMANRTENYTDSKAIQKLLTELIRMTPSLVDHGYGGYTEVEPSFMIIAVFSPNVTWAETNQTWNPFFDYAWSLANAGGLTLTNSTAQFGSFGELFTFSAPVQASSLGGNTELTSWLLPEDVLTDPENLSEQLMQLPWISY